MKRAIAEKVEHEKDAQGCIGKMARRSPVHAEMEEPAERLLQDEAEEHADLVVWELRGVRYRGDRQGVEGP